MENVSNHRNSRRRHVVVVPGNLFTWSWAGGRLDSTVWGKDSRNAGRCDDGGGTAAEGGNWLNGVLINSFFTVYLFGHWLSVEQAVN